MGIRAHGHTEIRALGLAIDKKQHILVMMVYNQRDYNGNPSKDGLMTGQESDRNEPGTSRERDA